MRNMRTSLWLRMLAACFLVGSLAACATGPNANPQDPLEPYNRSMDSFNQGVDKAVLKPVATAYQTVTPTMARTGVSNFFANLGDAWSMFNNLLQFKLEGATASLMRVSVNTFLGLGGTLDLATEMRMPRHKQDFGLTLGRWGVGTGPYVVLPILGPSTLRDTAALPVDIWGNPLSQFNPEGLRVGLNVLRVVDTRASLLQATDLLEQAALDPYAFTRDSYLQLRRKGGATDGAGGHALDGTDVSADASANDGRLPEEPEDIDATSAPASPQTP